MSNDSNKYFILCKIINRQSCKLRIIIGDDGLVERFSINGKNLQITGNTPTAYTRISVNGRSLRNNEYLFYRIGNSCTFYI